MAKYFRYGIIAFIFGVFISHVIFNAYDTVSDEGEIGFYNGKGIFALRGTISAKPDRRRDHQKLTVIAEEIQQGDIWIPVSGKILLRTELYPIINYQDRIEFRGKVEAPYEDEEFSYKDYLSLFDIESTMYRPNIIVIGKIDRFSLLGVIFRLGDLIAQRLNLIFPGTHSALVAGILLGARTGIDPVLLEEFQITGLTHIIAVSGYNVAIFMVGVGMLTRFCKRRTQVVCMILSVIFFVILTGLSASVVRAGIMGMLAGGAILAGRPRSGMHLLFVAAFGMILWNPKVLIFDKGFQLSYAATLGLFLLTPHFERWLQKIPERFEMRGILSATLSAQIFTLRFIYLPSGLIVGFWTSSVISFVINTVHFLSKIPFAAIEVLYFEWWMVVGAYLWIALWIFSLRLTNLVHQDA
ncbi:MAG: internalization-related competence protein ComEC/Rec2 protein [Candidatus Peregrinibacteria bacterium GW2011_GWA2_47_7]|nr:MAG: internalization-related competence protein ComEC/Rec2 protein [Candidatus Peregrinibacteria bacterium GW2011_GWA2_47_7]